MRSMPVDCASCHGDPDGVGPLEAPAQGDLAYTQPSVAACASCHDDWDPDSLYTSNGQTMPIERDNAACKNCHRPSGTALDVIDAHVHPLADPGFTGGLTFEVQSVTDVGGDDDGASCSPTDSEACGDGICRTRIVDTVACIGFGPGDSGVGLETAGISVTQETAAEFEFGSGVYDELPLRGMILWDSHAFNLQDEAGLLRAWLNFDFAMPDEQISPVQQIFNADELIATDAPAFGTDAPCHIHEMPPGARVLELSTRMHRFGKRFRIFEGAFTCDGGPNDGEACSPLGYDFASPDICAGRPCRSIVRKRAGDCDLSGDVTVDEVITSVSIALGDSPPSACPEADGDGNLAVSVDEVITGVNAALSGVPAPTERDAEDSLLYVNFEYSDPLVMRFEPEWVFQPGTRADERSFTYCALYDNGFTDSSEVKRRSTSPPPPVSFPGIGGPCSLPTHCAEGLVRERCSGRTDRARDASCDSSPDAGDGMCDACPVSGGVTTEDEMFLLLGLYYLP